MIIFLISCLYSADLTMQQINDKLWYEIVHMDKLKRPKIALVLGGGGFRGLSQIGVLDVFNQEDIPIDLIVGTSIGAIIGSFYSSGMDPLEIEQVTENISFKSFMSNHIFSFFNLFFRDKLLSSDKLYKLINKYLKNKQFYDLNTPFVCVATDIVTGEKVVLRDGDVTLAVKASSCIPGIFKPIEYKQRYLVDGGIVDNLPIDIAKSLGADIIIAVNIESDYTKHELKKAIQMLYQISYIQGKRLNRVFLKDADIVLSPDVNSIQVLDSSKDEEIITNGRIETRKNIEKIKNLIIKKTTEGNYVKN